MKPHRIHRFVHDMKRNDARSTHVAVGALVIITILYATTII